MVVAPKVKGFMCTTAHPEGCKAAVKSQIDYVKSQPKSEGPKKVLVIGASMGYGLASRIALTYSCDADTIGIIFDKAGKEKRTASAGWYNTAAFETFATKDGYYAKSINGDAYSQEIKDETIELIKKDFGKVDMVIYSVAAPRRKAPDGVTYRSTLKTVGEEYTNQTIDLLTNEITEVTIPAATEQEVHDTIKVMGGEDWKLWIEQLKAADVLADQAITVAYSYIGPEITYPIYKEGSIGQAKKHLYQTADELNEEVDGLLAYVSVNKAVVTQSSAAIPIVPLYLSLLFKVMKEKGLHEDCIKQMYRLVHDRLCCKEIPTDQNRLIRVDDYEMKPEVQEAVAKLWDKVSKDNIKEIADLDGYWDEFYEIFGFGIDGVDYDADVAIQIPIPSLDE
ncbi:enoyl-ACP reductase FabV [Jutongia hominis]|uniref:Trans-2-enoyl-CoA reductase [NADH] n=1 Tax=Jutongia hominis TaxID=2763664 RepID=A0ABR7MWS1_9FIRM|nr:enoyl-ACP reductase FabV [Jutongia hominis]MBC8558250.1 trans-2-enoyl-CoA reductase family protein [Jutongia hominis]